VRAWIRVAFGPYRARLAEELEDLEQEILLELLVALRERRYEGRASFRTYVHTVVHHKCIDLIRARRRRSFVELEEIDPPAAGTSALERLSEAQARDLALRVLAEMPESCRELWRMIQEGLSYREMSARLGVAEGALRVRVLRCRRRAVALRERLGGGGGGNEGSASTTNPGQTRGGSAHPESEP
jgi:RNA polymerase sigma factor (sigma-70 family)